MDRRASLALFLGKKEKTASSSKLKTTTTLGTLNPYMGVWGIEQAAHLLRRTTFGPTKSQIKQAVIDGLESTVNQLLMNQPMPDPPIYYDYEDDPNAGIGETWIELPYEGALHRGPRNRSMYAWSMKVIQESGVSIREKMTLFWHNHFVVANTNDPALRYYYINFLRENSLGNFRRLVEGITIDPSMLQYLNGTQSNKNAPNENYARELLELFTIGKGEVAGPGDYTTFTEDDVVEIARALTGWRHFDITNPNAPVGGYFQSNRHDETDKQLSHRFDNVVISNGGDQEYKTVIDIILQKDEVSRFMSRNIYRWLVSAEIDTDVEANIIEPMAQIMRDNNYEIEPVVRALLRSDHFYEVTQIGCMINHPLDFLFKLINSLEIPFPTEVNVQYAVHRKIFNATEPLEMVLFSHPDVAGWKAFYQTPQYYRFWINSVTLQRRTELVDRLLQGFNTMGFRTEIDVLALTASLDNPSDPNALIDELAEILFPSPLEQEQIDALKDILIPGLPDFEWTIEYSDYASGNTNLEAAVESQLKALFGAMLKMPEVYLI